MGVLQSFEKRVQGAVAATFARLFGGTVHPREVADALQSEAASHLQQEGGRTIAPNRYTVRLGPTDHGGVGQDEEKVASALSVLVREYLDEQGWQTFGDIAVTLEESDALHTGQFRISSLVDPDVDRRAALRSAGARSMTQQPSEQGRPPAGPPAGGSSPAQGGDRQDAPPADQHHEWDRAPHEQGGWSEPSYGRPGEDRAPYGQPGNGPAGGRIGAGQPAYGPPGYGPGGYGRPGYGGGYPEPVQGQPGYGRQDPGRRDHEQAQEHRGPQSAAGYGQAGYGQPVYGQPAYGPPGQYDSPGQSPGYGRPGSYGPPESNPYGQPPQYGGGYGAPSYQQPVTDLQAVLTVDDGSHRSYALQRGSNVVGRGQDASFRLPDTSVSRRHVDIYFDGQIAVMHDLGSTNGTSVNGSNVQTWQLADGDVIRVGHSTVVFNTHR